MNPMTYKTTRFEGYKAWELGASYAPEKNIGINAYYGFNAKTQEGKPCKRLLPCRPQLQILVLILGWIWI